MEIEPDGQQFLNARAADGAGGDGPAAPPAPPPPTSGGGNSRLTIIVAGVVVLVLVLGVIGFVALSGGDDAVGELETGGASITVGDRIETTTTTEPERTTTTESPATTAPTSTTAAPFPDFGAPGAVQPGTPGSPGGANPSCPSGGIDTQVTATSFSQFGTDHTITVEGRSVNNTTAPVALELTVSISHSGPSQPNPWVQPVVQSRNPVPPGQASTWTFTGTINGGNATGITGIGGGFRWADPGLASCPTQ